MHQALPIHTRTHGFELPNRLRKQKDQVIGVTPLCAPSSSHRIFDQPGIIKSISCNPEQFTMSGHELRNNSSGTISPAGEGEEVPLSVNEGCRQKQLRVKQKNPVGRCETRSIDAEDDRRVRLGKEGSIGHVNVGVGGAGAGNRGSGRIYCAHARIRNNAA